MKNQLNASIASLRGSNEKLSNDLGAMMDEASELLDASSDGLRRYAKKTDRYVHANPWKLLGVVAAAGVLIGALLARR